MHAVDGSPPIRTRIPDVREHDHFAEPAPFGLPIAFLL